MKRVIRVCLTAALLACAGCTGRLAQDKLAEANVLSGAYVRLLDKTTPEQDKAHIRAMDAEILQLDASIRGTAKAAATRSLVSPAAKEGGDGK